MAGVLWSVLLGFGVNLMAGLGVLLWYRIYGTFLFHAAIVFVLPAYLAKTLLTDRSGVTWAVLVALLVVVVVAGVAVGVNAALFARNRSVALTGWARRKITTATGILLGSLGLHAAGVAALRILFSSSPQRLDPVATDAMTGSATLPATAAITGVSAYLLVAWLLRKTQLGLVLRAVTTNPEAAATLGFRGEGPACVIALLGGVVLGLGGLVVAADSGVYPSAGFRWLLAGAAAMIVGGANLEEGLIPGLAGGAALVAILVAAGTWFLGPVWADAVVFVALVVVVSFRPEGLFVPESRR